MRKISVLISLALCLIVGGVYATWSYAQGNVSTVNAYLDDVTKITEKVVTTAKGQLAVNKSALSITIDDANNDHVAECVFAGKLIITFKPNDGADETVFASGINVKYSLSVPASFVYEGTPIFSVVSGETVLGTPVKTGTGEDTLFTWEISADALNAQIGFYTTDAAGADGVLELHTVAEYDAFKKALHETGAISITVSEVTA